MSIWKSRYKSAIVLKGAIDCSGNPNYPAAILGDTYTISGAGKIGGASGIDVEIQDSIQCLVATSPAGTQAAVGANWIILQGNIINGITSNSVPSVAGNLASYYGTTGKVVQNTGIAASDVVLTGDTRITEDGIVEIIDGGNFALKTGSGSSIVISGNGTIVTFTSTAHGLQTGDQIIVSVVANAAVLPRGVYSVTYIDANSFSVINAGVATTSTCTYTYCLTGQLAVRLKFLVSGWELIGDITGNATVQIFYASAYNGTFSEITGGGISISASKVATGTNSGWTTTTLAQYGYLKFAVTANAGAMTNISVNIKGAKIV